MSGGSPSTSERISASIRAGAQCAAKRPPFTAERRLRIVLISTISAPQARSCLVISRSSPSGISGFSNSALPPPESRKSTVSSPRRSSVSARAAAAARTLFSSGTGCPASMKRSGGSVSPRWPYLLMTRPSSTGASSVRSAAAAIRQAALPTATGKTRPGKRFPFSARSTALSGSTASMAARAAASASARSFLSILPSPPFQVSSARSFIVPHAASREKPAKRKRTGPACERQAGPLVLFGGCADQIT